jgi:hypothetical protein
VELNLHSTIHLLRIAFNSLTTHYNAIQFTATLKREREELLAGQISHENVLEIKVFLFFLLRRQHLTRPTFQNAKMKQQ